MLAQISKSPKDTLFMMCLLLSSMWLYSGLCNIYIRTDRSMKESKRNWNRPIRSVLPTSLRPHAVQDSYKCDQTEKCKLTENTFVCVCMCVCDLIEQFFPLNFVVKDSIILQCQKVGQPYLFRKMCNLLWNVTFFGARIYSLGLAGKYKDIKSEIWLSLRPLLMGFGLGHITKGFTGIAKNLALTLLEISSHSKVFFIRGVTSHD